MGPDALLAPEQMVVLTTNADEARAIGRAGMAIYLGLPNYYNNLARLGFDETDWTDGGSDRLVYLDLSDNYFEGPIPESFQDANVLNSAANVLLDGCALRLARAHMC